MSGAMLGKSGLVQLGTTGGPPPDTWVTIGEQYEIGELLQSRAVVDVTNHSTSLYREILPALFELTELTIGMNYVQVDYSALHTRFLATTISYYRILWPDDYAHMFQGFVKELSPLTPLDDRITYNCVIHVTGDVTFSDTTP